LISNGSAHFEDSSFLKKIGLWGTTQFAEP